ncbi:hypothetical protein COT86_01360 [Candidatus Collierbacteria bacterium CG10_big_fil_rev_8_21_14_0_10_43_36]|uniref:Glycosyltransferase 2-like domain-containing protein n=3 Tax=Candidatus Collieribacteriota TaxID=1752725 RepID=A0A2H0DTS2_9BACT|nr:MAG: hypothetical protein COW83_03615 [Candidatus Collierbacteria bacterium CG22_combo_CG10-13_8_21_14_all_43_12]PIR99920.1 MAG: hypothetical protein COT86_01360 [Candidatus Collierbacteria bacterium CG10_big_fil_rev_8_21_14_0_10_43_36]PIZ24732.1 MAG: hypothetical protein COY48_01380 [Candidatus Collierbacteria bacterium CG_4_10_14_0_8_um_filter_43_86]PJB47048.1 MAG: hypothetical protein CO104_04855 [Candidatus Collierbacteria bacterium CG_4_9_14_3_um_filter_43_16]
MTNLTCSFRFEYCSFDIYLWFPAYLNINVIIWDMINLVSGTKPVVSLVVATINKGNSLDNFFISLKTAKILGKSKYELIVVVNTPTASEVSKLKKKWRGYGIKFLHEPKKGKPFAINTGIKQSKGKYVAFTDDDVSVFDPMWLEKMVHEFKKNPNLGYLSGNVISLEDKAYAQKVWEKNGGLSKGKSKVLWDGEFFNQRKFTLSPWLFHRICAGANSMIPKKVFDEIGPFNILLGEGGPIGHGYTLEIGYRIAIKNLDMMYNPEIEIYHRHPKSGKDLYRKMFNYGVGDSAYPLSVFLDFGDFRYLWWAFLGHPVHTLKKFFLRLIGKYNLPHRYILGSFLGSITGATKYLIYYIRRGKAERSKYLINNQNEK